MSLLNVSTIVNILLVLIFSVSGVEFRKVHRQDTDWWGRDARIPGLLHEATSMC